MFVLKKAEVQMGLEMIQSRHIIQLTSSWQNNRVQNLFEFYRSFTGKSQGHVIIQICYFFFQYIYKYTHISDNTALHQNTKIIISKNHYSLYVLKLRIFKVNSSTSLKE
jgi:hypothetical protein